MDISQYFKLMAEKDASDMFLSTGAPISIKMEGVLQPMSEATLTAGECKTIAYSLMDSAQIAEFEREILRERVKAGIAQARSKGGKHGRPKTAALRVDQIKKMKRQGLSHSEIARQLKIGRTSVRRLLQTTKKRR